MNRNLRPDPEVLKGKLLEEIEQLKQDLIEYGRHAEGCSRAFGEKYRCRCGWLRVKQALKNERKSV